MPDQQKEESSNQSTAETSIFPITLENMANRSWKKAENYLFANKDIICELALSEAPKAAVNLPIAFVQSEDKQYRLVMMQGFQNGENLLVSPAGRWVADFIPSHYRFHPFVLIESDQEKLVLCFNNAFSQLSQSNDAEVFFNEEEQLAPLVQQVFNGLVERWNGLKQSVSLVQQLNEFGLIVPWDISLKQGEAEVRVQGLFRADEAKLAKLSSTDLEALRDSGALTLAYCQMLSMNKLDFLLKLKTLRQEQDEALSSSESSGELLFGNHSDTGLNFDNL